MIPQSRPLGGKVGTRATLTKNGISQVVDRSEDPVNQTLPIDVPLGQVGMSISAGMNTDFGREKIEVSAWCTLPCLTDAVSIERTYARCYELALGQAKTKLNQVVEEFFPDLVEKQQ